MCVKAETACGGIVSDSNRKLLRQDHQNLQLSLHRRKFITLAAASLVGACSDAATITGNASGKKPNIILVMVDDLNDWVGAMNGHPQARTPNIDRLAQSGTLFSNAHAQAPVCGPSRTSLMTGLLPSTTGVYGHIEDDDIRGASSALKEIVFLPEFLRQAGYHTMGIGKLFHKGAPKDTFDEFGGRHAGFGPKPEQAFHWDQPGTSTDWGVFPESDDDMPDTKSAQWAAERLGRDYENPFFLSVGFLRPHVPWYVPQHWFDIHPKEKLWLPPFLENDWDDLPKKAQEITNLPNMPDMSWVRDNDQWKNIVQAYLASISFVDHCVGIVLSALEKSTYKDNTVIIFCSDHGYHLGEKGLFQKFTLWQRSTRVPLIMSGKGIPSSRTIDAPVGLIDIYPTLAGIASSESPRGSQGRSLLPLLHPEAKIPERPVLSTYGPGNHSVRTRDYTLIRYADGSSELYDRRLDPNEWKNLATDSKYQNVVKQLEKHLPAENAAWVDKSQLNISPYFRQK
jgi:arylsulfatase A-like enzyme